VQHALRLVGHTVVSHQGHADAVGVQRNLLHHILQAGTEAERRVRKHTRVQEVRWVREEGSAQEGRCTERHAGRQVRGKASM
jgi:hypothetical protein